MSKIFTTIFAASLFTMFTGNAFGAFADLKLIRVVYERTTGTIELVTDLGDIKNIIVKGGTFPGTLGTIGTPNNLFIAYFAVDRHATPGLPAGDSSPEFWVSGSTDTLKAPVAVGTLGFNTTRSTSTSVYDYYNSTLVTPDLNSVYTGTQSYLNSYRSKMTANQGAMGNGINIATRGNTEANLGPLVDGSGTVSVSQNMYYFVNANLAGSKGVAIATISTNADGSTVITPSVVTKTNQTIGAITFAPTTLAVGGTTTASATATSLLPVSFSSTTPATCSVTGSTVSGVAAGLCTIVADQAGDLNWNAAPQVTQNITVLATQAIGPFTFTPPNLTAGKTTTVSATASSSLPVTFASTTTPSICTTSGTNGTTVTGLLAGVCTITADQPGDAAFAAAPQISHNINVIAPFIRINSNVTAENTLTGALAAPTANATIDIQAAPVFVENVVMNNPVTINLNGGYNTLFNPQAGVFTTIQGSLTIRNGTLRVSQIAIK